MSSSWNISQTANKNLSRRELIELVFRLSIPTILTQISSIIMQYIDAAMVGSLGENATGAIGLISSSTWLFGGFCIAVSAGFSVQISHLIGAGRAKDACNVFRQALVFSSLFGVFIAFIGSLLSYPLPHIIGGAPEICADASSYFLIYSCTLPFMQLRQLCASSLQSSGNMKTPGILTSAMCISDIVFNFIFIFPTHEVILFKHSIQIFGFGMGVTGAALGTAFSEIITSVIMFCAVAYFSPQLKLKNGDRWLLTSQCFKNAAKIAIPIAIEHSAICGAQVASTSIVAPLGTTSVAANSLAVTAESLCYMPGYGIGSAATTLVGQSIGADRKDLARRFARISVLLGIVIMSIASVAMYILAPLMFRLLTPVIAVQALGVTVLRIEAFAEPLYAASITAAGALRGAGDTLVPSIMSICGMWGVRITLAAILSPRMGLKGVWIAMCIELCVRGALLLIRLLREKWLKNNVRI